MPGLSEGQGKVVRDVVQTVPDSALGQLTKVLAAQMGEHTMSDVRDIVMTEIQDRKVRSIVFSPFLSLCINNQPGKTKSRFPFALPTLLWNALTDRAPKLMAQAREMAARWPSEDLLPYIFNQACVEAAVALSEGDPLFQPVVDCLAKHSDTGVEDLIGFLDIASVLRDVILELPLWVTRMNDDDALSIRLAYRDVSDISSEGPSKLFEIVYCNLEEPWLFLRVLSAALERPSDQLVANSDIGLFGELLLNRAEDQIRKIQEADFTEGAAAGTAAAAAAKLVIAIVTEFEDCLLLGKNGPWGRRIAQCKRALTGASEALLVQIETLMIRALPIVAGSASQKLANRSPNIDAIPDPKAMARLEAALTFLSAMRSIASVSGIGVTRARVLSEAQEFLEYYTNSAVNMLQSPGIDKVKLRERIMTAANFVGIVHGQAAADILRRRAAAPVRR